MLIVLLVLGASGLAQNLELQTQNDSASGAGETAVQVPSPAVAVPSPHLNVATPDAVATVAVPSLGKIVMYRPAALMGAGIACPIRFKGQELVELGRGKFAEWHVPAGRYVLHNKRASIEVHVEPGEARYVRCKIKPGLITGRAELQIVDQESFGDSAQRYPKKEVVDPFAR